MNQESTHVLLAEDDDDDFLIFSSAAAELSVKVVLTRAENGDILIRLLDEKSPDILFLDILMPCRNGRQCIKEIRANKKFDALPVIIYSSLKNFEEVEFFYREGANLYVVKPSSFSELKSVLERILSIGWKQVLYYPPLAQFMINKS